MAFNMEHEDAEALLREPEADRLAAAIRRFRDLPVLDGRAADEVLGYDASGLPSGLPTYASGPVPLRQARPD
jgi:hypothetical protein